MTQIILLSSAAIVFLLIVIFRIKHKKNKKIPTDQTETSQNMASVREELSVKIKEYNEMAKTSAKSSAIRPEGNQQRNLDREVGGTEEGKVGSEKENDERQEVHTKDAWDDRSEEVDKMGSHIPLGSTAKKSMIWRLKKAKLDGKEAIAKAADALEAHSVNKGGKFFDSSKQQGGFKQMIRARQDRNDENNKGGGGIWR